MQRKREGSPQDFDSFSMKDNFRRIVSNKREISPAENESNSRSYQKMLCEDSRRSKYSKDLHYKRYTEPPKYEHPDQHVQEQRKKEHFNSTISPSEEYYPLQSENNLHSPEMKSDDEDLLKMFLKIPTVGLLKIFNSKFDELTEITEIEELNYLLNIIGKSQEMLCKSLQTEPKHNVSATYESSIQFNPVVPSGSMSVPQVDQFDIGSIRDIVKNENLSQSGSQNAPVHQYTNSSVPYCDSSGLPKKFSSNSGQPNVISGIPGLTVTENENPRPHPYSGYQTNFSTTKSNAMKNYPYRY